MSHRERLPDRRDGEGFAIEHLGLRFRAHVSIYPDGRLGEIFIDAEKAKFIGRRARR
jgi:hypothetical protein